MASPVLFLEGNAVTTKKRNAQQRVQASEEKTAPKKAVKRTKNCKRYAKKRVAEEWPGIVDQLVNGAKSGSYNHAKLLVEVSGIKEEDMKPAKRGQSRLTKVLLKTLNEKEDEGKQKDSLRG